MLIKRDYYLDKIINKKENGRVKVITGIRRCGKSYLLFKLYKNYLLSKGIKEDQIITMELDDFANVNYRNPFTLNDYVRGKITDDKKKYYVFIDEIQLCEAVANPFVPSKEKTITFVDVLLGLMKINNLDVYVTGSNSKMLSTDILTQFRDRGDRIHVNPLSFSEICHLFNSKQEAFKHYVIYGGMPYIYKMKTSKEKSEYLKSLFYETYIKDIIERNDVRKEKEIFEILLNFISSTIGSLTNPSKLSRRFLSEKQINITSNTISNYLDFFEEAYLLHHANRYDVKGSRYFSTPLKYYFSDIGLRNAKLNFRQNEQNHIMENIIYNELIGRGYDVDVGVVRYEDNKNGKRKEIQLEVDFVVNQGHQRYYIQSALNIDSREKRMQEIASLKIIEDSFKKIVVVRDDIIPWHDDNGIFYVGVIDFLLNKDLLN